MHTPRKYKLQTIDYSISAPYWSDSVLDSYISEKYELVEIYIQLTEIARCRRSSPSRVYRLVVDDIPLVEFDFDNLWILETYLT